MIFSRERACVRLFGIVVRGAFPYLPCPADENPLVLGSSRGRGTRAAAWFAEYCEKRGNRDIESVFLQDGIKGWAQAGEEFIRLMTGFEAGVWEK